MNSPKIQYSTVSVLSAAHLINDIYSNFLPQLLPFLIAVTGFGYAKATFLVSVFTLSSSIVQPLLGYFVDRQGKSWLLYVGTFWMTVFLSLMGLTTNYWVLVLLSALAGLGTATFHPQATALLGEVSGSRKGFMMSTFMAMGNTGFALSPVVFIPLLDRTGLNGTMYLLIPGILVSLFLIRFAKVPHKDKISDENTARASFRDLLGSAWEITKIVIVIVIRSTVYMGLIVLLPNFFSTQSLSNIASGHLVSIMLFAGAAGGLAGGWISDRIGRKGVTVLSLLLSTPAFFGFFYTQGIISTLLLALAGALLMGSFSVTVVAAQEVLPASRGLASGITIGLSMGLAGLAVTPIAWVADVYGLITALRLLFILPVAAGLFGLLLRKNRNLSQASGVAS